MADRIESLEVGERVRVEASTTAGEIVVVPGSPGTVIVTLRGEGADAYRIERRGDVISIQPERGSLTGRFASTDLRIEVPAGTSLELVSTSGDVVVNADVEDLTASSAAGEIRAGVVAKSAKVRTTSGDIFIDRVGERVGVETASGDVRIGQVGRDVAVTSASGDIRVDVVGESAEIRSASGDIGLSRFEGGEISVKTLSGDLRIGIPPRRRLEVDLQTLSGEVRNRLPKGDGSPPERRVMIRAKTVSGDVTLEGA